jgi:hypothetical protein
MRSCGILVGPGMIIGIGYRQKVLHWAMQTPYGIKRQCRRYTPGACTGNPAEQADLQFQDVLSSLLAQ